MWRRANPSQLYRKPKGHIVVDLLLIRHRNPPSKGTRYFFDMKGEYTLKQQHQYAANNSMSIRLSKSMRY